MCLRYIHKLGLIYKDYTPLITKINIDLKSKPTEENLYQINCNLSKLVPKKFRSKTEKSIGQPKQDQNQNGAAEDHGKLIKIT